MKTTDIQQEVDKNYEAFKEKLDELIMTDQNRYALMHDGEVIACFDTARDALKAGQKLYGDAFSIQEITDRPIDLGYLSHVGNLG